MSTAAKSKRTPSTSTAPGIIEPGVLYTLDEIRSRLRIREWALRHLRDQGLNVLYVGNRGYVMGVDFIELVVRIGKRERSTGNNIGAENTGAAD